MKLRFALEGIDPSRQVGDPVGRNPDLQGVIGWLMRFRLTLMAAGALAAAWAAAAPAGAASLNPQHAGLQVALRAQGLYLGPIDAIIGPKTVAAVRSFQRTHGLKATGIADLSTRRELGPLGTPLFGSRTLAHGKFGWDVAVLQFLLAKHGVRVPLNAYMDTPTVAGLKRYQRAMHLAADGVAGPATFAALGLQTRVPVKQVTTHTQTTLSRYVVKPGDSLTAIARKHGISLGTIAKANHLNPSRPLLIGVKLRIPAAVRAVPTAVSATNAVSVRDSLDRWSAHYGIDRSLARALAWMESGYNNTVVSNVGAQGVMQLLPSTWEYVENVLIGHSVSHDADGNVHVGMAYLNHLLAAFHGDERLALAGWYQGERAVKASGPYKVSKAFVADVLALRQRM
jgi:LysM repeat protein